MTAEGEVARILGDWQRARDAGEADRPADVIARHPELEEELRAGFALIAALGQVYAPERDEAVSGQAASHGDEAGTVVGNYRLLQRIGEGGMGTVWMAEQFQPVKRKVALKVVKLGMDTKQVIARFEAERQALAVLDHPHIAKVLDGGMTDEGRLYFVMELVKGVPITKFCDEAKLSIRERLALFVQVCDAITHAHAKGIIHRDIKPSNVMVTLHDGTPVVRVIDFGIAKATNQELTEKTLFTEYGQIIGTPEYMAPEQAAMSGLDIDTRADVYGLGALLYELLTGSKPFDLEELRSKGYGEMLRVIREEDPPKPSTRVSTSREDTGRISIARQLGTGELPRQLRGDLDWIVLKSMEKDRARRYETANGLAKDVQRYLADEPVVARPPSRGYVLGKFVKRHRTGVIAAGLAGVALTIGMLGAVYGLVREAEGRRRAEVAEAKTALELTRATEVKQLIKDMLVAAGPLVAQGEDTTLLKRILDDTSARLLEGGVEDELVAAELHFVVGSTYRLLGFHDVAEPHVLAALAIRERRLGPDHPDSVSALARVGLLRLHQGRYEEAEEHLLDALARRERGTDPDVLETLRTKESLASVYSQMGRFREAERLSGETLDEARRVLGPEHEALPGFLFTRANALSDLERPEARERMREAYALLVETHGADHPNPLNAQTNLANLEHRYEHYEEAEALLEDNLRRKVRVLGESHPDTLRAVLGVLGLHLATGEVTDAAAMAERFAGLARERYGERSELALHFELALARIEQSRGQVAEAIDRVEAALDLSEDAFGPDARMSLSLLSELAVFRLGAADLDEAARAAERSLGARRRVQGPGHPETLREQLRLASIRHLQRRYDEAYRLNRDALARLEEAVGPTHPSVIRDAVRMANMLFAQKRLDEAQALAAHTMAKAREAFDAGDARLAGPADILAQVLTARGEVEEAERLVREVLPPIEATEEAPFEGTRRLKAGLAWILVTTGRNEEAERLCREGLALRGVDRAGVVQTSELLSTLGLSLLRQSRREEALPYLEEAYQVTRTTQGEEARDTLRAAETLAAVSIDAGKDLEEPVALLEKCMAIRERFGEDSTPEGLVTSLRLGFCYVMLGRNADAAQRLRHYFDHADVPPDGTSAMVDEARRLLAVYEKDERRATEAAAKLRPSIEELEAREGEASPRVVEILVERATRAVDEGRHEEAEPLLAAALERIQRVHGGVHASRPTAAEQLYEVRMSQRRWREAQALAREILARQRAAQPPDAPAVLEAVSKLALALLPESRFEEAEQLCRQALAAPRPDHGSGGAATAKLIRALAWSLVGQLRFEEALPFLEEAYQTLLATEGEESPDAMQAAEELATIRMDAGRGLEQSAALLERCLAIREQQGDATVPEALFTSLKLGICYARLGRNAAAVLRFRPYFEHADVPPTGTNAVVDEARWRLELLEDCERTDAEAAAKLRPLIEELEEAEGASSPKVPELLYVRGVEALREGRFDDAAPFFVAAIERIRQIHDGKHGSLGPALSGLFRVRGLQQRWPEAEALGREILALNRARLPPDSEYVLGAITNLAIVLLPQGRFEEARALLEESLAAKRRVLPPGHRITQIAMVHLAEAYEGLGRMEDALALRREMLDHTVATAYARSATAEHKNNVAWLLLTHPIEELQDPQAARALAEEACKLEKAAEAPSLVNLSRYQDTLALAQHRSGDTTTALATQRRALDLAPAELPDAIRTEMRERLREFETAAAAAAAAGAAAEADDD